MPTYGRKPVLDSNIIFQDSAHVATGGNYNSLVLFDLAASQFLIGRRIGTAIYHWLLDLAGAGPRPLRCNSTEWRFLAFLLLLPLVRTYCSAHFIILSKCFPLFDVQYVYYFYHNLLDKIMVISGS